MINPPDKCELCRRKTALTRHHLIPRSLHRRKRFRRQYTAEELQGRIMWVCRPCHNTIHATFSEIELAQRYPSREKLLECDEIAGFVQWLADKPDGFKPKGRIKRRK